MPSVDSIRHSRPESEHRKSLILLRWLMIIMAAYLSLNLVVAVVMNAVNARVTRAPR